MEPFCVELISKMKKSIDFGISAKQSYMHVLWHHHFIERSEVSKNIFSMETRVALRNLLKIETTFLEQVMCFDFMSMILKTRPEKNAHLGCALT